MGFFDRFRKREPEPPPGVDLALVVYAVAAADAAPGPKTPCVVLLDFDPVDVRAAFEPPGRADGAAEVAALFARAVDAPRRDPNSRGRIEQLRRWVDDQGAAHLRWRLEPAEVAGTGQPPSS